MSLSARIRWRLLRDARTLLSRTRTGRRALFGHYFRTNYWGDPHSVSGPGSNLQATEAIRAALPSVFQEFGINTLLDIPCGDAFWVREINHGLTRYIGADAVPALVEKLKATARPNEEFHCLDAIVDDLPRADAVLTRDLFIHLSHDHIAAVLNNFRLSGARYLIASSYPESANRDGATGAFRLVNLERAPFALGRPLLVINENYARHPDKSLCLWELHST